MNELQVEASDSVLRVMWRELNKPRPVDAEHTQRLVDEVRQAVEMLDRICPPTMEQAMRRIVVPGPEMSGTAVDPADTDCPTPREMRRERPMLSQVDDIGTKVVYFVDLGRLTDEGMLRLVDAVPLPGGVVLVRQFGADRRFRCEGPRRWVEVDEVNA